MSVPIYLRNSRFAQIKARTKYIRYRQIIGNTFTIRHRALSYKRKKLAPKIRKGKDKPFFGRMQPMFNMALRIRVEEERKRQMLTPEECKKGNHNWNNEGVNPEFCLDCGESIWAHAFSMP